MKKTISFILLLIAVSVLLIGCGEHHLVAREAIAPTCEEAGHTEYLECVDIWCNYKEGYESIPATGHSFFSVEAKEPTSNEMGYTAHEECRICHQRRGYEDVFFVYSVCELLPSLEARPLISELSEEERGELAGIYAALTNFSESYTLSAELTISDVERIMGYLNLLCPELIHCGEGYSYFYTEDIVSKISFEYTMSKEEYAKAMAALDETVSGVVAATAGMSELDKEIYVHDYVIDACEYDIPAAHSGNAYGALVLGKAKCDGYSKAFSLLMMASGIECYTVSGVADGGPHAWNVVLVDGNHYKVDVTWDDCEAKYAFFNINDEIFDRSHDADEKYENLVPTCDSITLSVPYMNGTHVTADEDIALRLDELVALECTKEKIDVHFRVETDAQFSYLEANVGDIFTKYLEGKYQKFRFSTYTHDTAGYMRFVVDILN